MEELAILQALFLWMQGGELAKFYKICLYFLVQIALALRHENRSIAAG